MKALFYVSLSVVLTACGASGGSEEKNANAVSSSVAVTSSLASQSSVLSSVGVSSSTAVLSLSSSTISSTNNSSTMSSSSRSRSSSLMSSSRSSIQVSSSISSTSISIPSTPSPIIKTYSCIHEGNGDVYDVGDGQAYTSLNNVPFENLNAGDTVRIHYRAEPYRNRIIIANAFGTAEQPIRICGVLGPNNERPIILGINATTRQGLQLRGDGNLFLVGVTVLGGQTARSEHVIIEGLNIASARSDYTYTSETGSTTHYSDASACIRVQRGGHITIRNNELSDCDNGIFTGISDGGDHEKTSDLLIEGNYLHHNSSNTVFGVHNMYIQAIRTTIQFNYLDSLVEGAGGANIKTRSIGNVIRYNFVKNGARLFDMVEAMDNQTDLNKPELKALYDVDFVYGNIVYNDISVLSGSSPGSISHVHYGGDQFNESIARKGTLWYYNNTVIDVGHFVRVRWYDANSGFKSLSGEELQMFDTGCADWETECSTTPVVHAFNNVQVLVRPDNYSQTYWNNYFNNNGGGTMFTEWYPINLTRRANIDLRLGKNFFSVLPVATGLPNGVTGLDTQNLIINATNPINLNSFKPQTGSVVIGQAVSLPPELVNYPVTFQYDPVTKQWGERSSANDMGAIESD